MNETDYVTKTSELIMEGKYEDALKLYDEALGVHPQSIEILYGKAFILRTVEQYIYALETLEKVLEIDPNYIYALYDQALILKIQKKYDLAIHHFEMIQTDSRVDKFVLNQLGLIEKERNNTENARRYFMKALKKDPNFKEAGKNLKLLGV